MKRLLTVSAALLMLICSLVVSADENAYVVDNDALLSSDEEAILEQTISEISDKYGFDIVILTFSELDGRDIETYTADYFMDNGYGYGTDRDGLILSVYSGMDEDIREFCSLGHGYGEEATGVYFYNCLFDESNVVDKLSDSDFYSAFSEYLELADEFLAAYSTGEVYDSYSNEYEYAGVLNTGFSAGEIFIGILIVLAVSALTGFIYLSILKSKMNTAKRADSAESYVDSSSMVLRRQNDFFLYSNVSRVRIKSDSNSHGGGSFKSSGGSSFSGGSSRF